MEEVKILHKQEVPKPYRKAHLQVFHYDDDAICCSCCEPEGCVGADGCGGEDQ